MNWLWSGSKKENSDNHEAQEKFEDNHPYIHKLPGLKKKEYENFCKACELYVRSMLPRNH